MTGNTLPTTTLGASGIEVGGQGLGCMGISAFYGSTDTVEARAMLDHALELGVTLFDTADVYGAGRNEEFLSEFVRKNREQVVLATKFAIYTKPDDPAFRGIDNSPAYIRRAVEASLRRLGIETIDLYYMHRRDPAVPIEDTVGVMAELVAQGKVRALGLSEVTGPELRAAHAVHPIAAIQSEWSVFSRDVERTAVPAAAELGPPSSRIRRWAAASWPDRSPPQRNWRTRKTSGTTCPGSTATTRRTMSSYWRRCAGSPTRAG